MTEAGASLTTRGNPNVTLWSSGARNASTSTEIDVSGQPIASVVQQLQTAALNSSASFSGLPTNAAGTMPAGAKLFHVKWTARYATDYHLESGSVGAGSLGTVAAAYPHPASPTQGNTVSLGTTTPTGPCVNGICPGLNLRASFDAAAQSIRYHRCDSGPGGFTNVSNCLPASTGSYTIGTSNDGLTPHMRFTVPTGSNARGLVQRNGQVYLIISSATKFGAGSSLRMNRVAYNALAAALGISPAPTLAAVSAFMGVWQVNYTGDERGNCGWMLVDARGHFGGMCTSTATRRFSLFGEVSDQGSANISGSTNELFNGSFLPTTAAGLWSTPASGLSGNWTATLKR